MAQPEIVKDIDARIIRPTSTDNAIVRFDGTTGQVQNTNNTIDDNNDTVFTGRVLINRHDSYATSSDYSLSVGTPSGYKLDLGYDGFQTKNASGTPSTLYVNWAGGSLCSGGTIYPKTNATYDLGASANRFNKLYLSSDIYINDSKVFLRNPWWIAEQTHDVDTAEPGITFAYTSHNAPTTGLLLTFNCTSGASGSTGYPMQFIGQYNGNSLFYRHKNGDNGTWMPWKRILTDYDYTSVLNNTYLPLSGGTMSGRINLPYNSFSLQFRSSGSEIDSAYNTGTYYGTLGNECLAFVARQSVTSFMFVTGSDPAGWTSSTWNSSSPALQIKGQSVYVNSLITNGVSPSYNFYVNGTSCFNGASYFNETTTFVDRSKINKIDFSSIQTSAPPILALALKNAGYALYNDEEFASGNNNCEVYNNYGNGTVTIERISDSTAANTSGYILKITSRGNATPGYGGFYQTTYARANAVYFQLFRAKIPVGYYVVTASNPMGSDYKDYWITNTEGTGRWEWYGRLTVCGYTGTFSSGGHVYIDGSPTPSSSAPLIWYMANCNTYDLTKGAYLNATKVYGAIWNDYAEFRSSGPIEPGRVICETGNGTLKLSTERLQPGANVVSDTFGFAIGETENCKTPIAVSGRALVYTYEDRYSYNAGDPVCAGPCGTVSKMSREEVMMYPDRIVGTVSEIPEYERWGTGNVEVKNRIWIKVK